VHVAPLPRRISSANICTLVTVSSECCYTGDDSSSDYIRDEIRPGLNPQTIRFIFLASKSQNRNSVPECTIVCTIPRAIPAYIYRHLQAFLSSLSLSLSLSPSSSRSFTFRKRHEERRILKDTSIGGKKEKEKEKEKKMHMPTERYEIRARTPGRGGPR